METVSVSMRCTREEYMEYYVNHIQKPWFPGVIGAVMIVMSGVLQAVSEYDITAPMTLLFVCGVLALLFSPVFVVFWYKSEAAKRYDNAESLKQAITLTVSNEFLTVKTACHEGVLPLSLVTGVNETAKAFGIVFGNELEICLPKRVLTEEELTCVKAIFQKVKKDNLI